MSMDIWVGMGVCMKYGLLESNTFFFMLVSTWFSRADLVACRLPFVVAGREVGKTETQTWICTREKVGEGLLFVFWRNDGMIVVSGMLGPGYGGVCKCVYIAETRRT